MKVLFVGLGLLVVAGCSAASKTCFDQIVACGESVVPCAATCASQAGCVVDLCKATPVPTVAK